MGDTEDLLEDEEIGELILDVAGKTGLKIAKELPMDEKLSEFKLAEDLDMEVNSVRSILYKLYNHNFVSYDKRRDEERGWYVYHWKLLKDNLMKDKNERREERVKKLEERKKRLKNNQFFKCEKCNVEYDFSDALEHNFLCRECDGNLKRVNKSDEIKKIKEKIAELKEGK